MYYISQQLNGNILEKLKLILFLLDNETCSIQGDNRLNPPKLNKKKKNTSKLIREFVVKLTFSLIYGP